MILMIVVAVQSVLLGFLWSSMLRRQQELQELTQQYQDLVKKMAELEKGQPLLINADLLFAKQLSEHKKQVLSLEADVQELMNKRHNDGSYPHALRILEMGGTREEVIHSCHLSSAEADLLMNLQAYRSAIKANQPA